METLKVNNNQLTTAQIKILDSVQLKSGFSSSITNGGYFSSYDREMRYYSDDDWAKIDHLTEVEVTEEEKDGELKGGRQYSQSFGTCYFVDVATLKLLNL